MLANGCFDLLHPGHIAHLKQARSFGDFLIVSLTIDQYVDKGPGRPLYTWRERADLLRELRCVDDVVPSVTALQAIRFQRPNIYVKGIDYKDGGAEEDMALCRRMGIEMRFTDTPKLSSTNTLNRILELEHERIEGLTSYHKTKDSLPFKNEVLAVIHKFGRGGSVDDEAVWDGERWTSRRTGERFDKDYFNLWRRLET